MELDEDDSMALYWDSPYAIAVALMEHHPNLDPEKVGLEQMTDLIENLPGFKDDLALVTERILLDIQITWYEEMTA
jgi:FeS assembly protein IscX